MGFDWSSLAAPVLGFAGDLFGANSAADQANKQFERQVQLMNMQHAFNKSDYLHRYQWATKDLRAAGLNPVLAATNGIGGNVNGTGLGAAGMAATPNFGSTLASAASSAFQTSSQKEIAKLQNELGRDELELRRLDVNSAIDQRKQDMVLSKGRFELEQWQAKESIRLKEVLQNAQIKNMVERLQADIEHMARQDANGAVSAAAAMAHANAAGLMAEVQEKLGISRQEMMEAQQAYLALQGENAEESLKWQRWLNDHPYTRGAVGLLGSIFDTAGLAMKIGKPAYGAVSSGGSSAGYTYSDDDYESWIR